MPHTPVTPSMQPKLQHAGTSSDGLHVPFGFHYSGTCSMDQSIKVLPLPHETSDPSQDAMRRRTTVSSRGGDSTAAVPREAEDKLRSDCERIERLVTAWEENPLSQFDEQFTFDYKQRMCTGTALHILALQLDGASVLARLLNLRADIQTECSFCAYDRDSNAQAIHFAAGRGNLPALEILLERKADVNARSTRNQDGKKVEHYTALHEATYFSQMEAVELLLKWGAKPDLQNVRGWTPLHMAAEQGSWEIAHLLLEGKASIDIGPEREKLRRSSVRMRNRSWPSTWAPHVPSMKQTPLQQACESGHFPPHKLYLLTHRCMDSLIEVANHSPEAAWHMMMDESAAAQGKSVVHTSWNAALVKRDEDTGEQLGGLQKWCELMNLAPQAAQALLEAVTVTPAVVNPNRHPLRRRAAFHAGEEMRCYYTTADTWNCNIESCAEDAHEYPKWHDFLAPQPQSKHDFELDRWARKREHVIVKIKRLELQGVMNERMLNGLASTPHLSVFASLPVQAIVAHAWDEVGSGSYYSNIRWKVVEMCALVLWVILPRVNAFRPLVWSMLCVVAGRDVFRELCEMYGYAVRLRDMRAYITGHNILDWSFILPLLHTIVESGPNDDWRVDGQMVALVAFVRWLQLCYALRAVPMAGRKLLPIFYSFMSLGGILMITVFIFCGFLHAFLALGDYHLASETLSATGGLWEIFLAAFRLLFVGDGDGIDYVLELGPAGQTPWTVTFFVVAVMLFLVCILNLFIAVHSEAYDSAQDKADVHFLQEKVDICLSCFLRPHWPPSFLRGRWCQRFENPNRVRRALLVLGWIVWYVMLRFNYIFLPSAVLLAVVLLADCISLQRPWDCANGVRHSLWICHRADFEPGAVWHTEGSGSADSDKGKVQALKVHLAHRFKRTDEQIARLGQKLEQVGKNSTGEAARTSLKVDQVRSEVQGLGGRLDRLEGTIGALVQELQMQRERAEVAQTAAASEGAAREPRHHRLQPCPRAGDLAELVDVGRCN